MTKIGTLKELGVKPGDVVEFECVNGKWIKGTIEADMVANMGEYGIQHVHSSVYQSWRIVSRAAPAPKLWRDMTPEEKGALLLAAHEGKVIECFSHFGDGWFASSKSWKEHYAYRIKPDRIKSDWSAWFVSKQDGTTKFDPAPCAEVERVALGDSNQFAYRFKKWME